MNDRGSGLNQLGSRRRGKPILALLLAPAAVCLFVSAPRTQAGSIFMKNGYIIQGPIAEYSEGTEGSIVLGWPNGKVTIYRRFVERVEFEQGEEKNLKAAESAVAAIPDEVLVTPEGEEALPQNLSDLIKLYNLPSALVEGHAIPSGPSHTEGGGVPGGDPATGVDLVSRPPDGAASTTEPSSTSTAVKPPEGEALAQRSTKSGWGFSLRPPGGWKLNEGDGCVSWMGKVGSDGFVPSMNVVSAQKGILKWEEACRALREDQGIPLRGYQFLGEENLEVGSLPAYRVTGRGAVVRGSPSQGGRQVMVRQVLLEKDDRLWLISTFTNAPAQEKLADLLDRAVQTFQFEG